MNNMINFTTKCHVNSKIEYFFGLGIMLQHFGVNYLNSYKLVRFCLPVTLSSVIFIKSLLDKGHSE